MLLKGKKQQIRLFIRAWETKEIQEEYTHTYLNYMIPEVHLLPLFPSSVLHIEHSNQVSSPAPHQPIKQLKQDTWHHPQLREWVWQCEKHLSHLHACNTIFIVRTLHINFSLLAVDQVANLVRSTTEPCIIDWAPMPEELGQPALRALRIGFGLHFDVVPGDDRLDLLWCHSSSLSLPPCLLLCWGCF